MTAISVVFQSGAGHTKVFAEGDSEGAGWNGGDLPEPLAAEPSGATRRVQ